MKVGFLIGGTQKGGTTALDSYLRIHPSVWMAKQKEVHFFDDEVRFREAKVDYSAYHAAFDLKPSGRLPGEATPIYMYWYAVPRRVWEYNPAMKWIIVLRNPIERAYSHWNMERSRGLESLPFFEAVKCERERCREALPEQHRVYSYVDRGFYTEQIRRIWHFFPVEQTLFLKSEELHNVPGDSLNKLSAFLGIEHHSLTTEKKAHVGSYNSAMSGAERAYLRDIFEVEIRALEKLLGWNCGDWLA